MKTGINVSDAMTKKPVIISPEASVIECAKLMIKNKVGGLIVKEKDDFVGMVTEKDLVEKVIAKKLDIEKTKVNKIMSTKIISIEPDRDLYDAILKMSEESVRRLPVIYKNKVVGLLTEKDILKIEPHLFNYLAEKLKIREEQGKRVFFRKR